MIIDKFYNIDLPKWPHCIIKGKKVSVDQAKDIIFKLDRYFTCDIKPHSNDMKHILNRYRRRSGLYLFDDCYDIIKKMGPKSPSTSVYGYDHGLLMTMHERIQDYLGVCDDLEYIKCDIADSCYIGGPNGLVDPSGNIHFDKNIGKYPSVEEVHKELLYISKTFPFLDMTVSLYDIEKCMRDEQSANCMVSFIVKNGNVTVTNFDLGMDEFTNANSLETYSDLLPYNRGSCGIPEEWFDDYADRVMEAMHATGVYDELIEVLGRN